MGFGDDAMITDFTCTCLNFMKIYICISRKHVIAISVIQNKFEIPLEAKTGVQGARRGPGRPKKVSKASSKE